MTAHTHASTRLARAFTLASLFGCLSAGSLFAGSETWTRTTTGGNWSDLSNWQSGTGYADGTGAVATLSATGTQTVNLDTNVTLGGIAFSNGTYTISSNNGSAITLATSTGTPNLSSTGTISATLAGTQGFTMNPGGTRTLTLSGANTYSGVTTLTNGNLNIRSNSALGATGAGNGTVVSQNSGAFPQLHVANNITNSEDITFRMNQTGAAAGSLVGSNLLYNDSGVNTLGGAIVLDRTGASSTNHIHWFGVQVTGAGSVMNFNGNISAAATAGQPSGTYADPTRFQLKTTTATSVANVNGVVSNGTLATGGLSVYTDTTNTGVVRLAGANTYTGSTVHQKGTLLVTNTTGSGTGAGAVGVANTAVFGGTGIVAPSGTTTVNGVTTDNGVAFASGSIVAPGDVSSSGVAVANGAKLTFDLANTAGKVTFASGAVISIDLNTDSATVAESFSFLGLNAGSADVLFNNNTVNFSVSGTALLQDGIYTLATFDAANAYSGTWVIGAGLSAYTAKNPTLIFNANSIQLQIGTAAVPEPASFAALGGALALGFAATGRRRRK